ncbi:hypothetical protein CYMTET_27597 [Cymbomonas tetramitiformis]|uniref:Uncharacterized protein n=1 Tax=Cymbomonas tetramitiformis TaxID=36881 RepID=A0AAE0FQ11_9CHLO|nr:hypothetical protein CYMTET_27597 [Cymbomonas tetramitiformis]
MAACFGSYRAPPCGPSAGRRRHGLLLGYHGSVAKGERTWTPAAQKKVCNTGPADLESLLLQWEHKRDQA